MARNTLQAIKGTHDVLPDQSWRWREVEATIHHLMEVYGYQEIRTPVFERTELFARGVGENTDIVSKEMYTFRDRGRTSLTLKPELTAPVVRAYLQHNLGRRSPMTKLYYLSTSFRQERPQAGRYRQFHQYGVEAIGSPHPEVDGEVIALAYAILQEVGLKNLNLRLNSLGSPACREAYRKALREYLAPRLEELSATSRERFQTNPLRILDTKIPAEIELLQEAPTITAYLSPEDEDHFVALQSHLKNLGIPYQLDLNLVRGLDYYTRTTFEITAPLLGAQNALSGGGRYDGLIETLGGPPTPAVGFGAGMERLFLALEPVPEQPARSTRAIRIYCIALGDDARNRLFELTMTLRSRGLAAELDPLRRSLKAGLREANRLEARVAVILGEEELEQGAAQVKDLQSGKQIAVELSRLADYLTDLQR